MKHQLSYMRWSVIILLLVGNAFYLAKLYNIYFMIVGFPMGMFTHKCSGVRLLSGFVFLI